jgi:hypothetical protein
MGTSTNKEILDDVEDCLNEEMDLFVDAVSGLRRVSH